MTSKKTNKFSGEVRARAVRMVLDHASEHPSRWAAVTSIAAKIGCTPQTLHDWVKKAEVDRKPFPAHRKGANGTPRPNLPSEASAILRDQLLAELEGLKLNADLEAWTLGAWPRANSLTPIDGDKVRQAFESRLVCLQTTPAADLSPAERDQPVANQEVRSRIDKSVLAIPVVRRLVAVLDLTS
jgi:transposase-like protein